jgi:hypothetical protein
MRILSYDEQRLLTPDQVDSYFEWLMRRPLKREPRIGEEEYLNGDYILHGTRRAYEWGE